MNKLIITSIAFFMMLSLIVNAQQYDPYKWHKDKANPIGALVETMDNIGFFKQKSVLKSDTAQLNQLKASEDYRYIRDEWIEVDTIMAVWKKIYCNESKNCHCCFSSDPEDCQVWVLDTMRFQVGEWIPVYQIKGKEKKANEFEVLERQPKLTIQTYPNPTVKDLFITSNYPIQSIVLETISGKLISSKNVNNAKRFDFNMQGVATGIYLLTIETAGGKETIKVLKQ